MKDCLDTLLEDAELVLYTRRRRDRPHTVARIPIRFFESFVTTTTHGTGTGLASLARLWSPWRALVGGRQRGRGTTFLLTLLAAAGEQRSSQQR